MIEAILTTICVVTLCSTLLKILRAGRRVERFSVDEIKVVVEQATANLELHSKRLEMMAAGRLPDQQFEEHMLGLIDAMIEHKGDRLFAFYCLQGYMYKRTKGGK